MAVYIDDKYIYIANVGDSRAYYMDDKGLHQITTDHTFVNLLLMQGKIEPEEVHTHPKRNMLPRRSVLKESLFLTFSE